MKCYHPNEAHKYSSYLTPPKQADGLVHTLSNDGPYAGFKNEHIERELVSHIELHGERMLDARAKWLNDYLPTDDEEPTYSDNEEYKVSLPHPLKTFVQM